MIPNDFPLRQETIDRMIFGIMNNPEFLESLNKWEYDFMESIAEQFDKKGNLSDKQCEILEKIFDKMD